MTKKLTVNDTEITILTVKDKDYISLTDMIKAKDGDHFISNWLRNRNTLEFIGVWEQIHNPDFNYVEIDTIKINAGLNNYRVHPGAEGRPQYQPNSAVLSR